MDKPRDYLRVSSLPDFLPFSIPTITEEAIKEVVECLESGWITTGPRVQKFENMLQQYLSAPHVLAVNSATSGLFLVLHALSFDPGDEIITTPMTFVSTINVIIQNKLTPVFIDINLNTYNLDVDQIEANITDRTRAIMPVHFAGLPADCDPIYSLAQKYSLRVIEDSAHAIGASYKGKKIGSFGDIQVFSFHPNKNMTTGEGGAVVTRDSALASKINTLRFHGIDRESWQRFSKVGSQHYDVILPGYKHNMMDIQAALGIHQLKNLDSFIEKRTILAHRYYNKLSHFDSLTVSQPPSYEYNNAWHLFSPLVNKEVTGIDRDTLMQKLKERNIGTGLHYLPVHLFSFYQQNFGYKKGNFPKAESVGERIFSLPLFPNLDFECQDLVIKILEDILN